jgi:hypothetical protein
MGNWLARALVVWFLLLTPAITAFAQYRAAVLELATSDHYVDLVKAIAEDRKVTIDITVVPSARASFLVTNAQVDFIVPTGHRLSPAKVSRNIDYVAPLFPMAFVLYTNKNKPVDVADLKSGNRKGARIEVNISTTAAFGFTARPSESVEASLRRVDAGVIDGFIFSQATGDAALRKLGLSHIQRTLYANIPMFFGASRGPKSQEVERLLAEGMTSLRKSGKFDSILGNLARSARWDDWQP